MPLESGVRPHHAEEPHSGHSAVSVLWCLLGANTATFALWTFAHRVPKFQSSLVGQLLAGHFLCSRWHLRRCRFHTLITSCISHQRPLHFLLNSWALWTVGRVASEELATQELLALSATCSVGSSLGHILCHQRPVLGASGLLMGLLTASSLLKPDRRFQVWFVGDFSMLQLCDVAFASNLVGFLLRARFPAVAWAAHLGGIVAGLGFGIVARFFGDARFAHPMLTSRQWDSLGHGVHEKKKERDGPCGLEP